MKRLFLALTAVVVLFNSCHNGIERSVKPNIILIYADDLGIGLLSHEGQKIIQTPNIDKLAQEGLRFHRAYSNMLCAPARASLITGLHDCHKNRFQITTAGTYTYANKQDLDSIEQSVNSVLHSIPEEQVFLGEVAQSMGYKTAQFGKLEWGFSTSDKQMNRHGWDYYFGYLDHVRAHGFYPPFLFENGEVVDIPGNKLINSGKSSEPETEENFTERWNMEGKESYSQNIFMDSLLSFIRLNKDEPFFLYFPTQLPHGPVSIPSVHPDFTDNNQLTQIEKEYASMVKLLDDNVGQILRELKKMNIDDNTIVIFTADNGHEIYYTQEGRVLKPYTNMQTGERFDDYNNKFYSDLGGDVFNGNGSRAGLKRSNLEGGINVPLIVRWPQQILKGKTSNRLVANYDLVSTIAEITGYSETYNTDGVSFYKELIGEDNATEHEFLVYSSYTGPTLITKDGWKVRTYLKKDAFELYYLPDDAREANNLEEKHPEKLRVLKRKLLEACDGDFNNGLYQSRNQIKITAIDNIR
jgi:arylsulfatase A-like enzyme